MSSPSREDVADRLEELEEEYGQFDVRQTTVSVGADEHASAAEAPGVVDVRVRVHNDDGEVLVVDDDLPWSPVGEETSLPVAAQEAVHEDAGVDCVVEGLERVTIVCVRGEDDADPVYRLTAEFEATAPGGEPDAAATWRADYSRSVAF